MQVGDGVRTAKVINNGQMSSDHLNFKQRLKYFRYNSNTYHITIEN